MTWHSRLGHPGYRQPRCEGGRPGGVSEPVPVRAEDTLLAERLLGGATPTATADGTAAGADAGAGRSSGDAGRQVAGEDIVTPTYGSGPGFGALAVLAGLLALGALGLRRD